MTGGIKVNKDYIKKLLPEINEIKNLKLRQAVINAWLLAMDRGKWKKIEKIPFTLLKQTSRTLVEHTRCVTRMAIAVAKTRRDLYFDVVVAGGLVHDVGKLMECELRNNKYVKSAYGKLVRHPVSGYGLVIDAGLPVEVAHIVAAHSEEGEKVTRSPEAVLIHHCDFIDYEIERQK